MDGQTISAWAIIVGVFAVAIFDYAVAQLYGTDATLSVQISTIGRTPHSCACDGVRSWPSFLATMRGNQFGRITSDSWPVRAGPVKTGQTVGRFGPFCFNVQVVHSPLPAVAADRQHLLAFPGLSQSTLLSPAWGDSPP